MRSNNNLESLTTIITSLSQLHTEADQRRFCKLHVLVGACIQYPSCGIYKEFFCLTMMQNKNMNYAEDVNTSLIRQLFAGSSRLRNQVNFIFCALEFLKMQETIPVKISSMIRTGNLKKSSFKIIAELIGNLAGQTLYQ